MKLVMRCKIVDGGFKENVTLPIEYNSKEELLDDFMKLAKHAYKKCDYNYGRRSYFKFWGFVFEAYDYYYIFSDSTKAISESPPAVYTLEEWFVKFGGKG